MIDDLIKEIKSKQDAGNQIILGIDANEILEPYDTPVKKQSITNLMFSKEVLPAVKRSGFLPWGAVIASDHQTGYLDLDIEELFGKVEDSSHSSSRILHTHYQMSLTYKMR
mmetsp:Transcript_2376/g.5063  ORF Transcript_2376/g.5063 Transcript_2376/m.5063 type:complete len:111 (-) Transcript_2376:226-558(-)